MQRAAKKFVSHPTCCIVLIVVALNAVPRGACAEADELKISVGVDNELALLYRPDVSYGASRGAREYLPRFSAALDLGLVDWLDVGAGFAMSLPRDSTAEGGTYKGVQGVDVAGVYQDILFPARLGLSHTSGTDFAWRLLVEGGLALIRWETSNAQPNATYNVQPSLSIPRHSTWSTQGFYRVSAGLEWRPTTPFAMQFAPYFAAMSGGDVHIGLNVQGTFLTAVGI